MVRPYRATFSRFMVMANGIWGPVWKMTLLGWIQNMIGSSSLLYLTVMTGLLDEIWQTVVFPWIKRGFLRVKKWHVRQNCREWLFLESVFDRELLFIKLTCFYRRLHQFPPDQILDTNTATIFINYNIKQIPYIILNLEIS